MPASEPLLEKAKYREMSGFLGHGTNQTAELNAAIHSLRSLPENVTAILVSDSQYVLKGLTEWRKGWEARGWKNSQKKPIANKALWISLFSEYDKRKVTCKWVRGHNGQEHNERADTLATMALIDAGALPKDYYEQLNTI
jgi:ribonuclease HI